MRLACELDRMPGRLVAYSVEIGEYSFGRGMSSPVAEAADRIAERISADVAEHLEEPGIAPAPQATASV
ncbi:hypothetical protein L0U85_06825 [Glycomyces sp. L485]|uniref:hypothetical protein n=1 Tax=Glycomyces sp. L485 TaxID=2909235 RepID=UPI001F4A15E4|nr:hypothetical protein [Glycomyces sp. L485]MCH7230567.1 hypothetical protein [Glycomyces sp. L485]